MEESIQSALMELVGGGAWPVYATDGDGDARRMTACKQKPNVVII